jgi:Kdo2-lipid IVA lauroyltransferase/acyltransferase
MNFLLAGVFLFFLLLIGLIPFRVLYIFSDLIRLLLHKIVGYRKKVIIQNLKGSFPSLSEQEIAQIVRSVYKNLADVTVESIKGFAMNGRQVRDRYEILNVELIENFLAQGRSIIALPAHFNNWEWGSLAPGLYTKYPIIALYKPLSNKYIDSYLRKSRSKFGTTLSSIYLTAFTFRSNNGIPSIYVLAADQSPSNAGKSYWVNFMGRKTAFLHGPEKYARMYNMPVLYADVQRVKRGFYTLNLSVITDNPAELDDGEITKAYAAKLEEAIRKSPGSWLWSHRRWKLSP